MTDYFQPCKDCEATRHPTTGKVILCADCKALKRRIQSRLLMAAKRERDKQAKQKALPATPKARKAKQRLQQAPPSLEPELSEEQTRIREQNRRREQARKQRAHYLLYPIVSVTEKADCHCEVADCLDLKDRYSRTLCSYHKTENELENGQMIVTIMDALKRGYPSLESAFPKLEDIANYIRLRQSINSLGYDSSRGIWIPPPLDLCHRTPFIAGGSLEVNNIFVLSRTSNRTFKYSNTTPFQPPAEPPKALRNKVRMREEAVTLYGKNWLSDLADLVGESKSKIVAIRKQAVSWRESPALLEYVPDANVLVEGHKHKFQLMDWRIREQLGIAYHKDYWNILSNSELFKPYRSFDTFGNIQLFPFEIQTVIDNPLPTDLSNRFVAEIHTADGVAVDTIQAIVDFYQQATDNQTTTNSHNPFLAA